MPAIHWYYFNKLELCLVYDHTSRVSWMDPQFSTQSQNSTQLDKKYLYWNFYLGIQRCGHFADPMEWYATDWVTLLLCLIHVVPPVWWAAFCLRRDPIVIPPPRGRHSDEGIFWGQRLYYLVSSPRNALFFMDWFISWTMSSFSFSWLDILPLPSSFFNLGARFQDVIEPRFRSKQSGG